MKKELFESLERECWKFDLKYEFDVLFKGYSSKVELLRTLIKQGYDYETIKFNIKESIKTDINEMCLGEKFYN